MIIKDLGYITTAQLKTKLTDLLSEVTTISVCKVLLNLSDNSSPFASTQYSGFYFKLTVTRYYAILYRGDTPAQYIGHYNAGTLTWKMTAYQ